MSSMLGCRRAGTFTQAYHLTLVLPGSTLLAALPSPDILPPMEPPGCHQVGSYKGITFTISVKSLERDAPYTQDVLRMVYVEPTGELGGEDGLQYVAEASM